jgi:quinol monooxygenase YgiN
MKCALLNKLTARPGKRAELVTILLEAGKLGESNPDCIFYIVSESVNDPNVVWVQDLWTSKEQHEDSLKIPELRPFINQSCRYWKALRSRSRSALWAGREPSRPRVQIPGPRLPSLI